MQLEVIAHWVNKALICLCIHGIMTSSTLDKAIASGVLLGIAIIRELRWRGLLDD